MHSQIHYQKKIETNFQFSTKRLLIPAGNQLDCYTCPCIRLCTNGHCMSLHAKGMPCQSYASLISPEEGMIIRFHEWNAIDTFGPEGRHDRVVIARNTIYCKPRGWPWPRRASQKPGFHLPAGVGCTPGQAQRWNHCAHLGEICSVNFYGRRHYCFFCFFLFIHFNSLIGICTFCTGCKLQCSMEVEVAELNVVW